MREPRFREWEQYHSPTPNARNRILELNLMINVLEKGSLANDPNAPRRWEADRELALADCYAHRWSAQQYVWCVDDFLAHPQLSAGPTGYRIGGGDKAPLRGGAAAQEALKEVQARYEQVIAHHAGTPWVWAARNSRGFTITRYAIGPEFPQRSTPGGPQPKPVRAPKL